MHATSLVESFLTICCSNVANEGNDEIDLIVCS